MYPVSQRFLDAISSSHKVVYRARVYATPRPFGAVPYESAAPPLQVISGSVKMTSDSDIKATADLVVAPDSWDAAEVGGSVWQVLLPYGNEVFLERGVDFGDRTQEWVPLGYYRIDKVEQDDAPRGPIKVSLVDRTAWLMDNRALYPYVFPRNTTHRLAFSRLVNGNAGAGQSTAGYGMFLFDPVPITWTAYNPDQQRITSANAVLESSTYEFLAKIANEAGGQLRFTDTGELLVEPIGGADGPPVYEINQGPDGNAVRLSRAVTREGVYNIVSAYSADPAVDIGYSLAYNDDPSSPLHWQGKFGVVPRYYSSPLLTSRSQARAAARAILERYKDLPAEISADIVPNPALRPYDNVLVNGAPLRISSIEIPLTGDEPIRVGFIPLNAVYLEEDGT